MFSYNETLVLENNTDLMTCLGKIPSQELMEEIKTTVKAHVTMTGLQEEFLYGIGARVSSAAVTGEQVKNYFAIGLDGMALLWTRIQTVFPDIFGDSVAPLYENILEFLDDKLDSVDFADWFSYEITKLNEPIVYSA